MPRQRVYHDYVNGELAPYWYVLTFRKGDIDWGESKLFFEVIAPFEFFDRDQFDDSMPAISIYMEDLIINRVNPTRLGIRLETVKARILEHGVDPWFMQQFIIQMPDIEEVLGLLPNERKKTFLLI
ncbi:hypothetical protein ACFFIX_06435 [Metabacillus herbersteinensis]|uniref:Uncharacterized protein n=1 Tax=Metabacillus herbersteinensis TaxID=283816 RepID=A0ABV6GBN7_9BACI